MFPVEDNDIKKRVQEIISVSFKDTVNARRQLSDTTYVPVEKRGKKKLNCQKYFSKLAFRAQKSAMKETYVSAVGTPVVPVKKEEKDE